MTQIFRDVHRKANAYSTKNIRKFVESKFLQPEDYIIVASHARQLSGAFVGEKKCVQARESLREKSQSRAAFPLLPPVKRSRR